RLRIVFRNNPGFLSVIWAASIGRRGCLGGSTTTTGLLRGAGPASIRDGDVPVANAARAGPELIDPDHVPAVPEGRGAAVVGGGAVGVPVDHAARIDEPAPVQRPVPAFFVLGRLLAERFHFQLRLLDAFEVGLGDDAGEADGTRLPF